MQNTHTAKQSLLLLDSDLPSSYPTVEKLPDPWEKRRWVEEGGGGRGEVDVLHVTPRVSQWLHLSELILDHLVHNSVCGPCARLVFVCLVLIVKTDSCAAYS